MVKLPFGRKDASKPSKFLTVDIGSNSVKVMVFDVDEAAKRAEISGVSKRDLLEESTRAGIIVDIDDVEQALSAAVSEVTDGKFDITDVIFGVSGALSVGLMTTVRAARGKGSAGEPISAKEVSEIMEKTHQAAYGQVQNIFLEITGDAEVELQMITSSVVYEKIDDTQIKGLEGKNGQKIQIAVFTAFTPTHHLKTLQDLADRLALDTVAVGSSMYALAKSLSFSKGADFDGIIIDVGGELTDVGVVFGGGIVSTRSIDIGGSHFTKNLSREMNLSFKDAEHKKLEFSYGRLPDSDGILIKGYIDGLLDLWLDGIELLFQNFTGVKTFAPNIYLVGGGIELPDLVDVISKEPWAKAIPFKSLPEFSKISLVDIPRVVDKTGKASSPEYIVPAALSAIYLEARGLI